MKIVNNPLQKRFEASVAGGLATLDYRVQGKTFYILYVEVPEWQWGKGVGGDLTKTALDFVREQGYTVIPVCSFAAGYIRRHPEYRDLLSPEYAA